MWTVPITVPAQVDVGDVRLMFPCAEPEAAVPDQAGAGKSTASSGLQRTHTLASMEASREEGADEGEVRMQQATMLVVLLGGMHMSSCAEEGGEPSATSAPPDKGPAPAGACLPQPALCSST